MKSVENRLHIILRLSNQAQFTGMVNAIAKEIARSEIHLPILGIFHIDHDNFGVDEGLPDGSDVGSKLFNPSKIILSI